MAYMRPTNLPIEDHLPDPKAVEAVASDIPSDGQDLPELGQYQYHMSFDEAASLGFPVARLDEQYRHEVLLFQAARFKDISSENGATFRYGVALEAMITVSVIKGDLTATVAAVAAAVQLSTANASSSLFVRGYLPQAPLVLPDWGEFDVGAYSKFEETISTLQSQILFDNANIRPQLLATTMPASSGDYGSVVGQTYALDAISHGWTAGDALARLDNSDPDVRAAVEKTYQAAGLSDSERPGPEARLSAKVDLAKIHVPITRAWLPFWRTHSEQAPDTSAPE
jgi:hypothetical protein